MVQPFSRTAKTAPLGVVTSTSGTSSMPGTESRASEGVSAGSATWICRIPGVPLSKVAWLVTVAILLIAALLVLISGYLGYFGVLVAVAAAAAVNLVERSPRR